MIVRDAAEEDLADIVEIFNVAVATRKSTAVLEPVTLEERRPWLLDILRTVTRSGWSRSRNASLVG